MCFLLHAKESESLGGVVAGSGSARIVELVNTTTKVENIPGK